MKASWRTTLAGVLVVVSILSGQLQTLLDDDPTTNPEYSIIAAAIATLVGLWNARDNSVTSEQVGAKGRHQYR